MFAGREFCFSFIRADRLSTGILVAGGRLSNPPDELTPSVLRVISIGEDIEIGAVDHSFVGKHLQVYDASPVRSINKDDRNSRHLLGPNECEQFKQLVQRTETAGKSYQRVGPHREMELAYCEIMKLKGKTGRRIGIRLLLARQPDIEPYRGGAGVRCAAIRGFHDTRPPPVASAPPRSDTIRPKRRASSCHRTD